MLFQYYLFVYSELTKVESFNLDLDPNLFIVNVLTTGTVVNFKKLG